jgi:hypothetical protein
VNPKPLAVIEQAQGQDCLQLVLRIDELSQIPQVYKYLDSIIRSPANRESVQAYLSDVLVGKTFRSFRVVEDSYDVQFLVIDEDTVAFIFVAITCYQKDIESLPRSSEYFRWHDRQID